MDDHSFKAIEYVCVYSTSEIQIKIQGTSPIYLSKIEDFLGW